MVCIFSKFLFDALSHWVKVFTFDYFIWDLVHGSGSGGSSDLILGHIKYCKYTQYNDCVALNDDDPNKGRNSRCYVPR